MPAAASWRPSGRTDAAAAALLAALAASVLAGCGAATAAPITLHGAPRDYLLTIDQLVAPDFTVDVPAHDVSAAELAGADPTRARRLAAAGLSSAAAVVYFRTVSNIAEANGPVQIGDTVEVFGGTAGAASVFADDVARLDATSGAAPASTGPLGDAAHAILRTAADSGGVDLVEVTVEWRVGNVLDVLVVRGRSGGTRLDDALVLAHEQTIAELGLPTPTPLPTVTPSHPGSAAPASPSPAVSPAP